MYKYQMGEEVIVERTNLWPTQALIVDQMVSASKENWYKLREKGTGKMLLWPWEEGNGTIRKVDWWPEDALKTATHKLVENNPNVTFKNKRARLGKLVSYGQFCRINDLLEQTGVKIEDDIAKISYEKAERTINTLKKLIKVRAERE